MPDQLEHLPDCYCDGFSDCYKDITGHRPHPEDWTCADVKKWHDENYVESTPGCFKPRYGFHDER